MSSSFKPDLPPARPAIRLARLLAALALLTAAVPTALRAQGDTTFTAWLRFATPARLELREPEIFRSPLAGARTNPASAADAWSQSVEDRLDSLRASRATAWRLRRIYGRKAPGLEDSLATDRRGAFGLNRKYADLNIDGQARTELRTERLKNLRCTPAQLLDLNSGCRGGFKAPRLDTYLSVRAGGLIGRRLHVDVDYDTERDFTARNNLQVYYEGLEDEIVRRVEVGTVTFVPPPSRFIAATIPANNFGINATFEVGALQIQSVAATQKGSVVAERNYNVGTTTVQPQDREARDLDLELGRFFWVPDPATLPGYPAIDILQPPQIGALPPLAQVNQGDIRVYRYRPSTGSNNPNLGGINAIAFNTDRSQQIAGVWRLLERNVDYYVDPSGLWFALAARLDPNDYLAVSYRSAGGNVGTFPSVDQGVPVRDTLSLVFRPVAGAQEATFRHEIRNAYRVAGADLDLNSLIVNLTLNRSERPLGGGASTYLSLLGLATSDDPAVFNRQDRLFPRTREPNAQLTIKESYIIFPTLNPFADPRLLPTERNDSLYRTPGYVLFSQGPPAKFVFRLRYNASSSGDRSGLDLGALQIRNGSETLYLSGRRLERGIDYSIDYDLGRVTFLNPQALFGNAAGTIQARFEERGVFAVAPTQIYGLATRYSLGEVGGINLMGIYQVEQSAFNRPQLGFEAAAHLVGGISTDLRFRPAAVTRLVNSLTSTPATAPSRLDLNAELALTRPDPNRSGQAYLEEFEGDQGIALSLRENLWQFSSRPQFGEGLEDVLFFGFDTTDAVQLTWQNLIAENGGNSLRARDIDNSIQVAGQQDQLETVLYLGLQADTAGGQVRRTGSNAGTLQWVMPQHLNAPRWRSIVTPLSNVGVDLSKNEFLEFWVFHQANNDTDSTGLRLVFDLGSVSEDAVAIAPESLVVTGSDTVFRGRQFVGVGRFNTERQSTGIYNAETDDIGILNDRPDSIFANGDLRQRAALCRQQLSSTVTFYRWGDLSARCTNGNGFLDSEDLDGDNTLNATGGGENVFRWVVQISDPKFFIRNGVQSVDGSVWKLYRIPLRRPEHSLGSPNIRLIKNLRITAVAKNDGGLPDKKVLFTLARMRFLGSPWVRRSDQPIKGLAGSTGASTGEVVASTISTENQELGYVSPPGVVGGLDSKGGSRGEFGTQVNERSLRLIGRGVTDSQRVEAYFRFPSGPQNLLGYRELKAWFRGRGPGWGTTGDFRAYLRVGSDSRNFYQYTTTAETTTWLPEVSVNLETWRNLRGAIESRRLQGLAPDSSARVACGGDPAAIDTYVLCDGPYLVHIQDVAVNPPNLASVQEIAAGILRLSPNDATDSAEVWVDDIRLVEPISRVGSALAVDARLVASDVAEFSAGYIRQDGYFQQIGGQPSYRTTGTLQLATGVRLDRFLPPSLGVQVPMQVAFARTDVDPQLISGTDVESGDLQGLRRPVNWTLSYNVSVRRSARGRNWLVRGLIDPLGLSASFDNGRSITELSRATTNNHALNATYQLSLGRGGFGLDLTGVVDKLPGFLRNSDAGNGLRNPFFNLAPSGVRLSSGITRNQSDLISYQVPVARLADSLLAPITALQHVWRNTAGLSWQPLGMLNLSGDLASTRDLRRYSDSTSLGRLAGQSRRSLFGLDVGVERDRQLGTSIALTPRITSYFRPRFLTSSSFVLSRSLTSRDPIRQDGDTAGAFILPQTLNNSRTFELGAGIDVSRMLSRAFGDSSGFGRTTRRLRPFDISDRLTRNSTFDLAAFDPSAGYQLALGGLESFLTQGSDSAIGAAEVRATSFNSGADLPLGFSFTMGYSRTRTSRFQLVSGSFLTSETRQREWPRGSVRFTRSLRGGPIALLAVGTAFRTTEGTTTTPTVTGAPIESRIYSSTITPDAQFTLRNGMALNFSYNRLKQENSSSGNLTRTKQNDITGGLSHAFNLPTSISRIRRSIRSQFSGVLSRTTSCLLRIGTEDCLTISDTRRTEARATFDSDLARILTGGLSFSYSLSEARHLDRKFSQIIITASLQLSLFSGDYR